MNARRSDERERPRARTRGLTDAVRTKAYFLKTFLIASSALPMAFWIEPPVF